MYVLVVIAVLLCVHVQGQSVGADVADPIRAAAAAGIDLNAVIMDSDLSKPLESSPVPNVPTNDQKKKDNSTNARIEAQRVKTISEGQKLREEARKKAFERAKQAREGLTVRDNEEEAPQRGGMEKAEWHAAQREHRRKMRHRVLQDAAEEERQAQLEKERTTRGRRLQEKETPPTCYDGKASDGFDTDVDCGGECRDIEALDHGLPFLLRCTFAQKCNVNSDCISGSCESNHCAAQTPLQFSSSEQLMRYMHKAFFQISADKNSTMLSPSDVSRFFSLALNPDQVSLTTAQSEIVETALADYQLKQGLVNSTMPLAYGFLTRGASVEVAETIIAANKALSQTRREL